MAGLLDFLQAASNASASTVSGPVDMLAWLLQKAGVPVGNAPPGGSAWMEQKGLTKPVPQSAASLAGETVGLLSPIVAAAKAPQIAKGLLQVADNAAAPSLLRNDKGAIVWHGSPHKFDKFDSSKIGTGEGAQAYGHGLYLAENPEVAGSYIQAGRNVGFENWDDPIRLANKAFGNANGNKDAAIASLDEAIKAAKPGSRQNNLIFAKQALQRGDQTAGLYKVDLPDNAIARMLDWDRPLSQQPKTIQEFFEPVIAKRRALEAQIPTAAERAAWGELAEPLVYDPPGKEALFAFGKGRNEWAASPAAAQMLRERGIPGIRYLDGGSRGAGSGTSNFVVFPGEENILKILERNGQGL